MELILQRRGLHMGKKIIIWSSLVLLVLFGYSKMHHTGNASVISSETQIPSLHGPVLITSLGQSIDYMMMERILDNLGLDFDCMPNAQHSDLSGYDSVLVIVGSSKKGLSISNTSTESELKRISDMHDFANEQYPKIILVHMGGKNRRGLLSDDIIKAALPLSSAIIVVEDGDFDKLFSNYAQINNIWFAEVPDMHELQDLVATFALE